MHRFDKEMKSVEIIAHECKWHVTGVDVERILLIALKEGVIVGSSAITRKSQNPDDLYFESTFVNEGNRKMGIASLLNVKRLDIAERLSAKRIWGTVYRGNRFYLRWFLKHGFKIHSKDEVKDTVLIVREL